MALQSILLSRPTDRERSDTENDHTGRNDVHSKCNTSSSTRFMFSTIVLQCSIVVSADNYKRQFYTPFALPTFPDFLGDLLKGLTQISSRINDKSFRCNVRTLTSLFTFNMNYRTPC